MLKVGGSEVTELSGSGHDSSYYDDRSDHERERHREKKKKKKKKSEKEKHLDEEERRKRKVKLQWLRWVSNHAWAILGFQGIFRWCLSSVRNGSSSQSGERRGVQSL